MLTTSIVRAACIAFLLAGHASAADTFVNFESGHTRPLALSPDGSLLFAVNTPSNSLSVFEVDGSGITLAAQIPVGLEPVAVASRTNTSTAKTEAWVVNHLSDSVSVVEIDAGNLAASRVTRTLLVGDEPGDIVFGGSPVSKAFITTARRGQNLPESIDPKLAEEGVPRALVFAFDAQNTGAGIGGTPMAILELFGDTPRGLAVSPDGSTVYAAIFHSGNQTTAVSQTKVGDNGGTPPVPPDSPYFGDPEVLIRSLIVRFDNGTAEWVDELGRDWAEFVPFSLPDQDVFAINADANPPVAAPDIDPIRGVGTTLFNLAVRPGTGSVFVTNSEARNDVRFEPIEAGGVRGHGTEERISVLSGSTALPVHVNPHIDYSVATGPPSEMDESLALLGDLVFSSDGASLYVAAMGSNQVAVFDAALLESGTVSRELVDVGRGPSGVALDEANDRLYVMNRLDHTISIVSDASSALLREETGSVATGYDPTPPEVLEGRPFLYAARGFSGHGDFACASCHVFGDVDHLAWDLGNPYGAVEPNPNPKEQFSGEPPPFSPIKGPMTTQSLRGLADAGPMHWRGDRTAGSDPGGDPLDEDGAFKKFNPAFVDLLGRSAPLSTGEMQAFTDFVMTMRYPPNPVRSLDNRLTRDQEDGRERFTDCTQCHASSIGTAGLTVEKFKVAHLRNLYQKVGKFSNELVAPGTFAGEQVRGFGMTHDGVLSGPGEVDSAMGFEPSMEIAAFLFTFDTGLAPAVGQQVTIGASPTDAQQDRLRLLVQRDEAGDCDLTFAGAIDGTPALGAVLSGGRVQLDDSTIPPLDEDALAALAASVGGEQTYTCRPPGTGDASSVDRDIDGVMNNDEVREGTNPFDAHSVPFDCAASDSIVEAKMKIARNDAPAGDEGLTLKASWLEPSFAVDPMQDGMMLVLRSSGDITVVQSLPATGWWTVDGTKWTYAGEQGAIVSKARLSVRDGLYKLSLKGRGGDFQVETVLPRLELVLGGDVGATAGKCLVLAFGGVGGSACEMSVKTLKCS